MRRTLPSQLFRLEQYGGFLGGSTCKHQGGVAAELLRVLTSVPGCLEEFWSTIEPAYSAGLIHEAAKEVRTTASLVVRDAIRLSDHLKWLDEHKYSREDNRQIRYVIETYFHTEPCQAVLAAVAYRWIMGLPPSTLAVKSRWVNSGTEPRFVGAIDAVSDDGLPSLFAAVVERHGTPVPVFLRALAVWPEYLQRVWDDFDPLRSGALYSAVISDIKQSIDDASCRIPVCSDAFMLGPVDIAGSIQRCIDNSCEIVLYTAALRRMFIRAETLARNRRIQESIKGMDC